jgi:hypothetical protein
MERPLMCLAKTLAERGPAVRHIAVWRETEPLDDLPDLVLVAEARFERATSTVDGGFVEVQSGEREFRLLDFLGALPIFRRFGVHRHLKHTTKH